jgi:L-ascorbate metabolism protein UlaG (beta-lactamase superfamily)
MRFTYYGHATFAVEAGGKKLLFDPFISPNELAKHIDINTIEADYILLSHGHGDHVADVVSIAKRTGAKVIAMAEVIDWVTKNGVENVHPMNFGSYTFDFGRVSMVPAWHSSSMPDGAYGGNPGGFVLQTADGNFYYSGDTCLMLDMQLIPHYAKLDFAVLPIGGNYTMDAQDAVKALEFVQCTKAIGIHYDTFPVIVIDKDVVKKTFEAAGKEVLLPGIGETIEVN